MKKESFLVTDLSKNCGQGTRWQDIDFDARRLSGASFALKSGVANGLRQTEQSRRVTIAIAPEVSLD